MRGLLERIDAGEVLVGDGAWGTQLTARGLDAVNGAPVAKKWRPDA